MPYNDIFVSSLLTRFRSEWAREQKGRAVLLDRYVSGQVAWRHRTWDKWGG